MRLANWKRAMRPSRSATARLGVTAKAHPEHTAAASDSSARHGSTAANGTPGQITLELRVTLEPKKRGVALALKLASLDQLYGC